jgi:hypothetical protein
MKPAAPVTATVEDMAWSLGRGEQKISSGSLRMGG